MNCEVVRSVLMKMLTPLTLKYSYLKTSKLQVTKIQTQETIQFEINLPICSIFGTENFIFVHDLLLCSTVRRLFLILSQVALLDWKYHKNFI